MPAGGGVMRGTADDCYTPWVEAHFMSLARNIATVGGGTLVSRVLAYGRDAWIAALLGAGPFAEAFFAMLQVVNFFRRLLADGALNGAFVPVWLKLQASDDSGANANRFTRRSLIAMLCLGGAVALTVNIFAWPVMGAIAPGFDPMRQTVASLLLAIAALYIALAGVVAVLAAALNAENRVGAVAASTIAFNLVMIAALAFTVGRQRIFVRAQRLARRRHCRGRHRAIGDHGDRLARDRQALAASRRITFRTKRASFLTRAAPGLIAAGIPQLKLIAAAAIVSSSPAAVSWLYYANRLYELPLGVASIAIAAVIVPRIAASLRDGDAAEFSADAIARLRNRARPGVAGRSRLCLAGASDCRRIVSTRRVHRERLASRSPPRSPRSAPDCPAMCWRNCSARCPSPMATPARRC